MNPLRIATAQFENKSGDKSYNLSVIDNLTEKAKIEGANVILFHELCINGYTYLKDLSEQEIKNIAEQVPNGESTKDLIKIATKYDIAILAGIVEIEEGKIYNTMVCVDKNGFIARYRKIHPFISKYMSPGKEYVFFDLYGWKCSILICYDNNVIENVRAVALSGAQVLFAPHVTMGTPSPMPGREDYFDKAKWDNRIEDPAALRLMFDGPNGRGWLMRWLPARAYDKGIYVVFANPIGMDDSHLKNGNSLILDPYGEILDEVKSFRDDYAIATCVPNKLELAGGMRYKKSRKPELYKDIIGKDHISIQKVNWM